MQIYLNQCCFQLSLLLLAMEFSEEWKSLFPIGASTVSNLLLHSDPDSLGPLFFNPNSNSPTPIFSSTIPSLHLPHNLLTERYLLTSDPSILPSTASTIAHLFDSTPELDDDNVSHFLHNRIQLLKCPNTPKAVVIFPTGANDETIGFFMLGVKDSLLETRLDVKGDVFRASTGSSSRILRMSVNPVTEDDSEPDSSPVIGYVLASSRYSVCWFDVKHNLSSDSPSMSYLGRSKVFKEAVVRACWSPHILEESMVLLESGQLFLFDVDAQGSMKTFKGTRLRVPWNDSACSENKAWLSCEFSWHPRILIVARYDAVFLVDFRSNECNVTCLLKIETLRMYAPDENERFLALSRVGTESPDNFYFTVTSRSLLVLCDIRNPLKPVLQWRHGIDEPCYMTVLSLSTLRSHSKEDTFQLASEMGFCIILGSFWNSEFNIFCYGPASFRKGSITSTLSKINTTFCAWELPSEINLSSRGCHCGNCLFREELSKDALPEWIDLQLKKEMVLGFGILSNDLASLLCEPDEHGGFTLVRVMSSGKFELQRYHASQAMARSLEDCHEADLCLESHLLCPLSVKEYKYKSSEFRYLKLNYLYAYANGNLGQILTTKLEKTYSDDQEEAPFCSEVHELLCKKLNACGLGHSRSSPAISSIFKDVTLPASFHEVALRKLWTDLPLELLQLAFLSYSECREVIAHNQNMVPLEFSAVPDLPQLPPFFLRKPSPHSDNDIVGPVIPFPVLLVINEVRYGYSSSESDEFSVEAELDLKYKEVMQVACEIAGSCHPDDHEISLGDDKTEHWDGSLKPKSFSTYRQIDNVQGNSVHTDTIYDTFIFKVSEKSCEEPGEKTESVGEEMFDDLCPITLRFDAPVTKFEQQSLEAFTLLKLKMSKWQNSFDLYNEFCSQSGF